MTDIITKTAICGLRVDEILNLAVMSGYTERHALAVANAVYKKRISDFTTIESIPLKLRKDLEEGYCDGILRPVKYERSHDGSVKYLFVTADGRDFETVFIPEKKRNTVCVSSQSGCRMGCRFCATGSSGFRGNLTAGEIVSQVTGIPEAGSITHVVFMGMGEPLDNPDEVVKAATIMTAEWGLALGRKNITVSTVGITDMVIEFLRRTEVNLTFSLHSPFPGERLSFVPAEKPFPSAGILEILRHSAKAGKRRFSLAYVMMKDINDTEAHLQELVRLLSGSSIRVNLLPFHQTGNIDFYPSTDERVNYFRQRLLAYGISTSVRRSRGADIAAACGLLAERYKKS